MSTPIVDGWVVDQWGDATHVSQRRRVYISAVDSAGGVGVSVFGDTVIGFTAPAEVLAHQLRAAGWTVTPPKAGES